MSRPHSRGVTLTWLGHATVLLEVGGARLLTDPLLRGRVAHLHRHAPVPAAPAGLDGVLLSHVHRDHLDAPSLRLVAAPDVEVVLPRGAAKLVDGFGPVHELAAGESVSVGGVEVRAVRAWHEASRRPGGEVLDALGFLVEGVWFAGDTDLDDGMAALRGEVDVALVPVWGWGPSLGPGHMDPERAAGAVALVQPRIAVPIHWGTYLPYGLGRSHADLLRDPPRDFERYVAALAPTVRVVTLSPGDSLSP